MNDDDSERPLIVGLGGTTRAESSTERVLRRALDAARAAGADVLCLNAQNLQLPFYTPGISERSPAARQLIDALQRADGLIVASPGYHGGISGLVKNALDYAEDLRDAPRPYLERRAIGCIVCAAGPQAAVTALSSLRAVAHALRGWPTPLGATVNTSEHVFGEDGEIVDQLTAGRLDTLGRQVVEFAHQHTAVMRAA
jgi:FMN reductase